MTMEAIGLIVIVILLVGVRPAEKIFQKGLPNQNKYTIFNNVRQRTHS